MKIVKAMVLTGLVAITTGCVGTARMGDQSGLFKTDAKYPVLVGDQSVGMSKVGKATTKNILGFVVDGDSSISAAMKNGGITKIHHVDVEVKNDIFTGESTTTVYGE